MKVRSLIFSPLALIMFGMAATASTPKETQSGRPLVNISFPDEETLIRANVPVFGHAYIPSEAVGFRRWTLEYGAGREPKEWKKIKESTKPISFDPHVEGKVVWNINKEPTGNITNWAVGLGSYHYSNWGKNLNGIYTLRLTAESAHGAVAETRRTVLVGEAIIRLYGGTGISADLKCRLLIAPFAFDGFQSRVVAIVKQLPPEGFGSCRTLKGSEESAALGLDIYRSTENEFNLVSAIYRIYPNGLKTEPAATLEIEYDPHEFKSEQAPSTTDGALLYQWNAISEVWEPLKTEWLGNVARASVSELSEGRTYVALMQRKRKVEVERLKWNEQTALTGYWDGVTAPHTEITLLTGEAREERCYSDSHGYFRLQAKLNSGTHQYHLSFTPRERSGYERSINVVQKSGEVVLPVSPILEVVGEPFQSSERSALLICRDSSLTDSSVAKARSIIGRVSRRGVRQSAFFELAEVVPGTGNFAGVIADGATTPMGESSIHSLPVTLLPWALSHHDMVTVEVGPSNLSFTVKDLAPPVVDVFSPTHPSLLFANPSSGISLKSGTLHSLSEVSNVDGAWRIAGAPGEIESARNVQWPVNSFSTSAWPFIGFTYKLYNPAPWQVILRSENRISSFHLGCKDAWFTPYASSDALVADGEWHGWQRNLHEGDFKKVDSISFGSWFKKGYLRPDPSFTDPRKGAIQIRNVWIGKSYESRHVEIQWKARDASPLQKVEWWVDQSNESHGSAPADSEFIRKEEASPLKGEGICRFTLPTDGRWYFHFRATDIAGNTSSIVSYPLVVISYQGQIEKSMKAIISQEGIPEAEWKQPAGGFTVKIPSVGASLNPARLKLKVGNALYPLHKPNWNSAKGTIQISMENFKKNAPLGFNNEKMDAGIIAEDASGNELIYIPIKINVESPFHWNLTSNGSHIQPRADEEKGGWIAYWKHPDAPWMDSFPGCVNNVLVITKVRKLREQRQIINWNRPVTITPGEVEPLYWEESWGSPMARKVQIRDIINKATFDASGSPADIPGRPAPSRPERRSWIYVQTPTDPFEGGVLRMSTGKFGDLPARISRVDTAEALAALRGQSDNIIRLDGWLPPDRGVFNLSAAGARTISYAVGNDRSYRVAQGKQIQITAERTWTRFSVFITPDRSYKRTPHVHLNGIFYH